MRSQAVPQRSVDIIVVTGMSGSGKSTAINALEDHGYYCIDNLPTALVPRFVELCAEAGEEMARVGLGLDLRDVSYIEKWPQVRREVERAGHRIAIVFIEASDEVLLRRFSETRRAHPLGHGRPLIEALSEERETLAPLKDTASVVFETSSMSVHDLKRTVREFLAGRGQAAAGLSISVESFGYKYGLAIDADMVLDTRFLPNPYFVKSLRTRTGLDDEVARYVLERKEARTFLEQVTKLLCFLLPEFVREGRSYLTIGLGCTGGRHRSVAIAEALARALNNTGFPTIVRHRDIDRAPL